MRAVALLLLGAALAFEPAPGENTAKADREKLQGAWTCVYMERNGKALPSESYKDGVLTFEGDTFTYRVGGHRIARGTRTLNPSGTPKTFDDTHTDGRFKGNTYLGIYELQGDEFKACNSGRGQPRPTAFETKSAPGLLLIIYRRVKP